VPGYNVTGNTDFGALTQDISDTSTQINNFLGSNGFKYSRYSLDLSKTPAQWVDYFRAGNIAIGVLQQESIYTELGSA
jgi:hypothetical protein